MTKFLYYQTVPGGGVLVTTSFGVVVPVEDFLDV